MMEPTWPQVRCRRCDGEAHWRNMVMHIQETKPGVKQSKLPVKPKLFSTRDLVKWHLCPGCEAQETGKTEAEVMEKKFKKPMEHKQKRVMQYQEWLARKKKASLSLQEDNVASSKGKAEPPSSSQDEWLSSKDRTCSSCFSFCVLRV